MEEREDGEEKEVEEEEVEEKGGVLKAVDKVR